MRFLRTLGVLNERNFVDVTFSISVNCVSISYLLSYYAASKHIIIYLLIPLITMTIKPIKNRRIDIKVTTLE